MESENLKLSYGMEHTNIDKVTQMLAEAYWSPGIGKDEVTKGIENSTVVVNVYNGTEQIGFCRAISDKTRFAYLMDVIIDENYRRRGIGQKMIKFMLDSPELSDVYQWLLLTRYAHDFYAKSGFKSHSRPGDMVEIRKEKIR